MSLWLALPFLAQGSAMLVDEFYFHRKRGLTRWERVGHPLDTLTTLFALGWVMIRPYSAEATRVYIALCVFSCLFITKDEFVHAKACEPGEHWLHSLLFVLHSVVFVCVYFIWQDLTFSNRLILGAPVAAVGIFFVFQIFYWNFSWKPTPTPVLD